MQLEIGKVYKIEGDKGLYKIVAYDINYPSNRAYYILKNIITKKCVYYYIEDCIKIEEATEKEINTELMLYRASVLREKFHGKTVECKTTMTYYGANAECIITSIILDVVYSPDKERIFVVILNVYNKSISTVYEEDIDLLANYKVEE